MLLLGPRPETPEYVDADDVRWRMLEQVPPGIAGPTQLVVSDWERRLIAADPDGSAYCDVVLPVKLAIDQWYVDTMSFRRDLDVAIALAKRFLPGSQASRMRRRVVSEVPEAQWVER
jgi:lipopolysaccharide/colanic/teichoic acid biosynthesis glycosyltransferase